MSSLTEKMMRDRGLTAVDLESHSSTKVRKAMRKRGVPNTPEIERIIDLERRVWSDDPELEFMVDSMTEWLRSQHGTQRLRPLQAAALTEIHDYGGLLAPMPVGSGKTHVSYLAPVVMEEIERPLLVIPAKLRDKTEYEFELLAKHWRGHPNLEIVSYALLGRASRATMLGDLQPDMIIADEVQRFKNLDAASTKRMHRYMMANPNTIFVGMSGTITKRSLMDFHHLLQWALGPEQMPLPYERPEARLWALAVDEKVPFTQRMDAGALRIFCSSVAPRMDELRAGLASRIIETPGVVAAPSATGVDASIIMEWWTPTEVPEIRAAIDEMSWDPDHPDKDCFSPAGDLIVSGADYWRHVREASLGFCYTWRDPAPQVWLDNRKEWRRFVREVILDEVEVRSFNNRKGEATTRTLDSEFQVASACAAGSLDSGGRWEAWQEVKGMYTPVTIPHWLTTAVLEQIVHEAVGKRDLIWVEHVEVGLKLAELTGLRFFQRGGKDASGTMVEKIDGAEAVILSTASNAEGRNLQAWSSNTVVTPQASGLIWEQKMGRTHRPGQEADEVSWLVVMASEIAWRDMGQALRDAEYLQAMTQTQQKLLLADRAPFLR